MTTVASVTASARLLAAAEAIVGTLAEHAEESERLRQLAAPSVHAMTEAGMWRILTPRTYGGWEAGLFLLGRIAAGMEMVRALRFASRAVALSEPRCGSF